MLSAYYVDDEASLKYLDKYPLSVCIEQRNPQEEGISLLENWLLHTLGKTASFGTVQQSYSNNTPEKYIEAIALLLDK